MPLRAYINNEEVISVDLSDDEWNRLRTDIKSKKSVLTLPCCGQEGFLRTSHRGLKHFVHAKTANPCDWKPESSEHLKAKVAIMEACRENGWEATPEYSEKDWRADVLAMQGEKRIAFEVQWSRQSYEETRYRQERYKASNVRGCWFFRIAPKEMTDYDKSLVADKEIPAFRIFKDENSTIVATVGPRQLPLKTLVASLLNRKLKFCEHVRVKPRQEVSIILFETKCWKCRKPQYCYTVYPKLATVCGQKILIMDDPWSDDAIDKNPQVYAAVQQFAETYQDKDIKIGQLKRRFSNTVKDSYLSHGCYYCDALFGAHYLNTDKLDVYNDIDSQYCLEKYIRFTTEITFDTMTEKRPHWCFSEDGHFCE